MNPSMNAGQNLFSAACPSLSRRLSVSSLVLSSVLFISGALFLCVGVRFNLNSDTLSMILFTVGTVLLLFAVYRFFWKSRESVYTDTGSPVSEGTVYFDTCNLHAIQQLLDQKAFASVTPFAAKHSGNVRLDFLVSKDRQFAAVQLFLFVPYMYEPVSPVYYFKAQDAECFVRCFKVK